jgi:uncharacterized RDD family membrane protein YckC
MDYDHPANPYSPPGSDVNAGASVFGQAAELAERGTRLWAITMDGSRISFGTGVFLRNWISKLIGSVPYLGTVFHLADCLFIFREDRRCIHDHIAGTRVVRYQR